uniref:Endonuclease/exonuclease/phosphatase domain-containing protein n=1 Tax=Haplochromis burtoni TaxID=8153 RepID=A0A3Q2WV40_HAPBU
MIKSRNIITGRLLLVDCCYYRQKLRFINVYNAPDRTKKMQLLKKMYLLEIGFNIILCGDFNIVTEATDRISNVEFRESRRESKLLVQICKEAAVRDLYRVLHPHTIHYTRFDSLTKTRIDRFYISSSIQSLKYDTFLTDFSDHMERRKIK